MDLTIWAGGRLRAPEDPVLTAVDHGVTVGDGVFETCSVQGGVAFALTRHLARLERSARGMGMPPLPLDEVREGVAAVLAAAGDHAGRLRITVTGGPGPMGSHRYAPAEQRPTVVVVAGPAATMDVSRAVRSPWVRNERSPLAGLKTTSYGENVVALAHARARGADEALLADTRGRLCEGTGSNVLVEVGGELLTPSLETGALAGVTRELLLLWGGEAGLPVREAAAGELPWEVLDEVTAGRAHLALTGSIRNVTPVVRLDDVDVAAGPLSLAAQRLFAQRAAEDLDP
ncbi:aminotransferase class IV [Cellulomonas flavigena DSM 20109]|uniref:Aminotransferase class IV n=1 Tax=Cellulomonas flavigena (strain ATCC 482 / DSM 20109 / BCRC 11376 / JCM 18109 / NBRC 3775 / NCIMB 8073 / NRS 134) TaxID=446466 RepID=D5UEL7_CELFN|nr:aminotransferase class IV [Cellulomonas flavigena]ADG74677.1 aminotransferase class IV [Cellulomonas flavigena DSM 20109]